MSEFDNMNRYFEMDYEVNKARIKLNFQGAVLSAFKFLIDEYGFYCIGANLLLVKYESKDVFIKIYHDRLSYELELYIGLRTNSPEEEISYSLVEIMNLAGDMNFTDFVARTITEIKEYLPNMADLLKKYAAKAIQGEHDFYSHLAMIRKETSHKLMAEEKEKYIRPDVEKAWAKKDYKQVAKLYGAYERYLTPEEKIQLQYARERSKL